MGFAHHCDINNVMDMSIDRRMWWWFRPQDMTYVKRKQLNRSENNQEAMLVRAQQKMYKFRHNNQINP